MSLEVHKQLIDQKKLALILGTSEASLEQNRFKGVGIPYIKIGRSVRYRLSDVEKYLADHTITTLGAGI